MKTGKNRQGAAGESGVSVGREKIVLIGAGSAMFTKGMVADLINRKWDCELALVDIDDEALKVARGLTEKMIAARKATIDLTASTDRRDVLKGATAVICTIGVGGRRAWEQDVFVPRKYGVYQPVGDSVMPGGTSRALRMIPAMVDIAEDVLDLCPDALFFNYGNPMSPVCHAVRKATDAKLIGLCHGVFHVSKYLANMLGVAHEDMDYTAVGMNHLTWFTAVNVNGKSCMGRLADIAGEQLLKMRDMGIHETKYAEDGSAKKDELAEDINPFSWHLMQLFGAFPSAKDRHVTEFFPQFFADGSYYGKKLGVDAYSFESCIAHGDKVYEDMKSVALSFGPLPGDYFDYLSGEHEQVVDIIESIRTDAGKVFSANVPNSGQIPNIPENTIVECPVIAGAAGLEPIAQGALSEGIVGTLASRFRWVEVVVEAALEGSKEKFVQALVLDGAVDSMENAQRMADELISVQKAYLPQFGGE